MTIAVRLIVCLMVGALSSCSSLPATEASDAASADSAIRAMVRANAEKDWKTLSRLMAHDADIISYTIGGRKYVGWPDLERDMLEEFTSAAKLEIPIRELKVWTKGDLAWYTMELDYIRTVSVSQGQRQERALLPLRETGVLERRQGQWVLLSWHESFRNSGGAVQLTDERVEPAAVTLTSAASDQNSAHVDLSGEWDIHEVEDNKNYRATLDKTGNGPYTQQGGRFVTTKFEDRSWQGTWHQTGNDREGGFDVLLSEDGTQAKGVWWYTRVGDKKNIPPRQWGGTFVWKRVTAPASAQ
ncbi:MAG TPA: nuclear transport factor 2 family protein [Nitrospira sp.]|nr:nuclear transport factor 2 family protein [Nitrospira sp.]